MHLDHGNSFETCKQAIDLGFTSVMIDGSLAEDGKTPNSYEANVEVTRRVVEMAHAVGVTVEGELGVLGGIEDGHGAGLSAEDVNKHLTDPSQAEDFVAKTGLDALAVAIGTSHGAYKSGRKDPKTGEVLPPALAMDRIVEIHKRMPNCHMVMHGSSSVPKELVDIINQYGGKMPGTFGIPLAEIRLGIEHGVRKVNVDTDSRLAMTGAIRKVFVEKPEKFDPRDYLKPARDAAYEVYVARMNAFGQAGHAGDYKQLTLDDMKAYYKK
jgi:fructose-bisphosphate aldolase class II